MASTSHRGWILVLATFSLLALLQSASFAAGGSVSGRVTDAATGKPLDNVSVLVTGTSAGAATDVEGRYSITDLPAGTWSVTFSRLGYRTVAKAEVVITTVSPTYADVELDPVSVAGKEVLVRASLFSQQLNSPPGTSSLTREEIRRFPGGFEDIVRTVATLPGVAVVSAGGRNDLLVRGGGPSENLYVVNDIEVPNINHFGVQGTGSGALSFLNLDFVDQVKFSAGGFGVESGDKLSSVLDIDLRPGRTDRLGGRLTLSASQFGADAEGPVFGGGSAIISARKSYLDLIFKAAGLPFVPVYTDYNLAGSWERASGDRFRVIGLTALDRVDRDISTRENRVTNAGIMDNTQDQYIAGASYRHLVPRGYLDFSVGVSRSNYRFSQADENLDEYFASDASETEYSFKVSRLHAGFFGGSMKAGAGFTFAGIQNQTAFADTIFDRNGARVPLAVTGLPRLLKEDDTFAKGSFYLEYRRPVTQSLSTTLGIRYDRYQFLHDRDYPTARFGFDYELADDTKLKASFGRYYQPPSYVWLLNPVNDRLDALRNDMTLLGVETLLREDLLVQVEGYYKNLGDLPAGDTPQTDYIVLTNAGVGFGGREDDFGSFGYQPLASKGRGEAYGLELQAQKRYASDGIYGQAGLSLGRSRYRSPNGVTYPGQYDQTVIFSLSAGYKPNARWEFSGKFRFWTGAPYTPVYRPADNGGKIQNLPSEYLSQRLKPGHHLDLRADRRFAFDGWGLTTYIDIQNIYNYAIPIPPSYNFWTDKIDDQNGIALLPTIGVRAEF